MRARPSSSVPIGSARSQIAACPRSITHADLPRHIGMPRQFRHRRMFRRVVGLDGLGHDLTYRFCRLTGDGRLLIGGGPWRARIPDASTIDLDKRGDAGRSDLAGYNFRRRGEDFRVTTACWPGLSDVEDFAPSSGSTCYPSVIMPRGCGPAVRADAVTRSWRKRLGWSHDLDGLLVVQRRFPDRSARVQAVSARRLPLRCPTAS